MEVDFHGYLGGDENPEMPIHAEADVEFIGLLITPGNLSPKPSTLTEVQSVAAQFVDLATYQEPEPWRKHGFILRPKLTEQ